MIVMKMNNQNDDKINTLLNMGLDEITISKNLGVSEKSIHEVIKNLNYKVSDYYITNKSVQYISELTKLTENYIYSIRNFGRPWSSGDMDIALDWIKDNGISFKTSFILCNRLGRTYNCIIDKLNQLVGILYLQGNNINSISDITHLSIDYIQNIIEQ